jgi:NAD(P)-dependent dehydrogenase (short-subunit alcohol dehydrogenase family)
LGRKALKELEDEGLKNVRFHQLDISSIASINAFESYLKLNHGRLDILVNNAAMIDNVTILIFIN